MKIVEVVINVCVLAFFFFNIIIVCIYKKQK